MRAFIFVAALLLASCGHSDRYIIEGTTSLQDGYYYLLNGNKDIVDSAAVVNGKYRFEGKIDSLLPVKNIASTSMRDPLAKTRFAQIFFEGKKISICEDDNSPTGGLIIKGSKANMAIYDFVVEAKRIQETIRKADDKQVRAEAMQEYIALVRTTIEQNLDNFASLYLLIFNGNRFTKEEHAGFLSRLSPAMCKTNAAKMLKQNNLAAPRQVKPINNTNKK